MEENVVKPADLHPLLSLGEDKKKSLTWARTNRLQLPKVRKLPARLSENRIRTNAGKVKGCDARCHVPGGIFCCLSGRNLFLALPISISHRP